jgi:hypothetical protein
MPSLGTGPIPLSAPGLIGPNSILNPPWAGSTTARKRRVAAFSHAHLEVDLAPSTPVPGRSQPPVLRRLENLLERQEVVEGADLVRLVAGALHALASLRFRRVDHWEVVPGGWLPPPQSGLPPSRMDEPLGALLHALEGDHRTTITQARKFSARASDLRGNHVDLVVQRVHRRRAHSLSVDLWGFWTKEMIADLAAALKERLPVVRVTVTKHQYSLQRSRHSR